MTAIAEVQQAQAALDAAKARERDERHAALVAQLQDTTTRLEEQRAEYAGLRTRVLTLRARRKKLQDALSALLGQEAEHAAAKPRIADHLPNAPSVIAWRQAGERLAFQRAAIIRELYETQIVGQMDIDLAKLGVEIERLQFAQHNLVVAIEDKPVPFLSPISEAPMGGLSRVQWK